MVELSVFAPQRLITAALAVLTGFGHADVELARTAWGHPDLDGVWDFRTLTPFERPAVFADKPVLTPEEAQAFRDQTLEVLDVDRRGAEAAVDIEAAYNFVWYDWGEQLSEDLRTSLIVDPPHGRLPALTRRAAEDLAEQNRERRWPVRDLFSFGAGIADFRPDGPEQLGLSERCLLGLNAGPPLSPSAYNNNLRIIQTPDRVLLVTEMIHDARVVWLDGRDYLPEELRQWSGDSRGHWEGNTLVVRTRNFTDKTPLFQTPATLANATEAGGAGSGLDLQLVERFTRNSAGGLTYEYTIDAPETFVQPFTVRLSLRKSTERMYEYACHEGNYAMQGVLKGARQLELEEAAR